ncbi:MAG: 2,3,4,5-tetrahydropyridine-2,6-dicarboxylate N-succinyltransferase [Candidatus Bathyarchaeota archaeon]|nr:2,3,4,5-tetrahydropyridine-2,6-dicarboxylate N-succinyltransferase [Candidatus Termiticorpusculum sp.]
MSDISGDVVAEKYQKIIADADTFSKNEFMAIFCEFKEALNQGKIRVAEKRGDNWVVNQWIKQMILLGFKYGNLKQFRSGRGDFFDKETFGDKIVSYCDKVRIVSPNVSIRDGCYLAPGVICLPPCFVNVGAYVDEGTLIDSNSLVGSCAQIGKKVHLSSGAQIGGVLEPIVDLPVIVEDNVFIGGNCGVFDGTIIKKGAIIGAGTIITGNVVVYDIVKNTIYSKSSISPLIIPEGAVVVPGARMIENEFFSNVKLSIQTPIIVKYIDVNSQRIKMEDLLRC